MNSEASQNAPEDVTKNIDVTKIQLRPIEQRFELLFGSWRPFKTFFHRLKKAVLENDANALSEMVYYPLDVNYYSRDCLVPLKCRKKNRKIKNKDQFLAEYKKIMPDFVKNVILKSTFEDLSVFSKGAMIGDGQVWFLEICDSYSEKTETCVNQRILIDCINHSFFSEGFHPTF